MQIDLQRINKCILHQQICFYRHGHFFRTTDCFLTSEDDFAINFQMQEYLKLHVLHINCMHNKTGLISLLSNKMFLKNATFFNQVGRNFNIPENCIQLTKTNNVKCKEFFGKGPDYILHCRQNFVFATGNVSYTDPLLQLHKLSYVPVLIPDERFPIQINNIKVLQFLVGFFFGIS